MMVHQSKLGRSVKDILRLCNAFRYTDLSGRITPAKWVKGDPTMPTDFGSKMKYYKEMYGGKGKSNQDDQPNKTAQASNASKGSKKNEKDQLLASRESASGKNAKKDSLESIKAEENSGK